MEDDQGTEDLFGENWRSKVQAKGGRQYEDPLAVSLMGQHGGGRVVDSYIHAVLLVCGQLRKLQSPVRLAWSRNRLHGLDLAFCRCHPDRSRAQRRDGAPNCAGHDGRRRETSRHARCSHGRPRRSSSKLEASRHPQIKRELGPLSGPSLNRTDVDTDPAPTSEPPRG